MSRPLNKGSAITLRLPLEVDAEIRGEAERAGISVGLHIANLLIRRSTQLPTDAEVTVVNQDDPAVQAALENRFLKEGSLGFDELYGSCTHPKARIISGGLKHCDDCNATTNIRGEWP